MTPPAFGSEAQLVEAARDWLIEDGWLCHFEVTMGGGGSPRADIVATRGPLVAVVECKMTLGLSLLEQCTTWRRYAHVVWAAVPRRRYGCGRFVRDIADHLGVGIVTLDKSGRGNVDNSPSYRRKIDPKLRDCLVHEHTETEIGTNSGYRTPFTATVADLRRIVSESDGRILVKDAMLKLTHHYSTDASCKTSLTKLASAGIIRGIGMDRDASGLCFVSNNLTTGA